MSAFRHSEPLLRLSTLGRYLASSGGYLASPANFYCYYLRNREAYALQTNTICCKPLQTLCSWHQGMVKELTPTEAHLSTGEVLPYGIAVWSTGVGPTSFTTSLPFAKTARGRIAIDGEMRALQHVDPEKTAKSDPEKPSDVGRSKHFCLNCQS